MGSTFQERTRRTVSKALRRGESLSARVRGRLDPGSETSSPNGEYGDLWNPPSLTDAIASIYNTTNMESFEEGGRQDAEWLSTFLPESPVVLDLGCGIGRIARYMAPVSSLLWAVDVSRGMLDLAAVRLADFDNVRLVQSHDTRIPEVPDNTVDVAYSLLVLQHVEKEDAFLLLEELHRVLKPTGRALLSFPNLLSDIYLESFLRDAHTGASTQKNRARVYTPQEVERIMAAAGFDCELDAETEIKVVATPR